jgi:hypothetical protein
MAKGIAHREWVIKRADCRNEHGEIDEGVFRATVENEAILNVQIMERLGVAVVSAPIRELWADGGYHTVGYVFRTATVPGVRDEEPERDVEVEVPDLAGVGE